MKNSKQLTRIGFAVATLILLGFPPTAVALIFLAYETGPLTGTLFLGGPIKIRLDGVTASTSYAPLPTGSAVGFGLGGTAPNITTGVGTLDALAGQSQAPNAFTNATLGNQLEDLWGIARVSLITDENSGSTVWSPSVKNREITIMFYGGQDFYLQQTTGTVQTIAGVGLRADWYVDTAFNFTAAGGPNPTPPRTGNTYPTATDGQLALTVVSVPGPFPSGAPVGTEYGMQVGATGTTGTGYFSPVPGSGPDAGLFAANARWDFATNPGSLGWSGSVHDTDPIFANVLPEPAATSIVLAGLLPMLGSRRRCRQ